MTDTNSCGLPFLGTKPSTEIPELDASVKSFPPERQCQLPHTPAARHSDRAAEKHAVRGGIRHSLTGGALLSPQLQGFGDRQTYEET